MAINAKDVIATLPESRQEKIRAMAGRIIDREYSSPVESIEFEFTLILEGDSPAHPRNRGCIRRGGLRRCLVLSSRRDRLDGLHQGCSHQGECDRIRDSRCRKGECRGKSGSSPTCPGSMLRKATWRSAINSVQEAKWEIAGFPELDSERLPWPTFFTRPRAPDRSRLKPPVHPPGGGGPATRRRAARPSAGQGVSGDTKTDPPGDTKTDPLLTFVEVGLWTSTRWIWSTCMTCRWTSGRDEVHLRSTQEDARMLKPDVVDRIRELVRPRSREQTDRSAVGDLPQLRSPLSRRSHGRISRTSRPRVVSMTTTQREVQGLFDTVAEGNTVVIQQELAARGIARRAPDLATGRRRRSARRHGPRPWPRSGSRPRRVNKCRSTSVRRSCRSPATRDGPPDDRGPGLLAAALLPGLPRPATGRLARGHRWGFPPFRRPPEQILCDNASPLVISHDRQIRRGRRGIPASRPSARTVASTPRACRPPSRRTKGKIERGVGYVKHNALAGRPFVSFEALQRTWPRGPSRSPINGFTAPPGNSRSSASSVTNAQALRPLPARPLAVRTRRLTRRVSADCFVDIDTIRYSVPHRHVRETVEVVVGEDRSRSGCAGPASPSTRGARAGCVGPRPGALRGAVPHGGKIQAPHTPTRTQSGGTATLGLRRDRGRGAAMSSWPTR